MKIRLEKPEVNIFQGLRVAKMKKLDGGALHEKLRLDFFLLGAMNGNQNN